VKLKYQVEVQSLKGSYIMISDEKKEKNIA